MERLCKAKKRSRAALTFLVRTKGRKQIGKGYRERVEFVRDFPVSSDGTDKRSIAEGIESRWGSKTEGQI